MLIIQPSQCSMSHLTYQFDHKDKLKDDMKHPGYEPELIYAHD